MDKLNLLPCPFCGGEANKSAYDRGIDIGCASCGYSRHFPGLLQSTPNDKPIAQYRNDHGGITEIPASEATEFYHADANERAIESWNRRAAPSSSADELPPLPEPDVYNGDGPYLAPKTAYSERKLREYGKACASAAGPALSVDGLTKWGAGMIAVGWQDDKELYIKESDLRAALADPQPQQKEGEA